MEALKIFFGALRRAPNAVLFLDYDGTCAPFVVDRMRAFPYPEVRQQLSLIQAARRSRIIMVSGRPANEVNGLLGLPAPVEVFGCHGLERLSQDGALTRRPVPELARVGLEQVVSWAKAYGCSERLEIKPVGIVIHWRGMEHAAAKALRAEAEQALTSVTREFRLTLQLTDGGLEVRVPGINKAGAINQVYDEAGEQLVGAFLGDDATDEDGFAAINSRGGLSVLVREEARETKAKIHLVPPQGLVEFLAEWYQNNNTSATLEGT